MPFLGDQPTLTVLDTLRWRLVAPLVYQGRDETFTVPAGMSTDLASVPACLTWIAPRYGTYTRAAILHDWLCETKPVSRRDADGIFRRVMEEMGVSAPRRWLMWAAVRAGSHLSDATGHERLQWAGLALVAVPLLILPTALVWIGQTAFDLLERDCR